MQNEEQAKFIKEQQEIINRMQRDAGEIKEQLTPGAAMAKYARKNK